MASESVIGSEHFEHCTCMCHLISGAERWSRPRLIPTRREEPDTIGRDALRRPRRSMERGAEDSITVRASDGRGIEGITRVFPEVCLSLFHVMVKKPNDSSTTWGAHERLAIRRG